jgi:hypothetical protein
MNALTGSAITSEGAKDDGSAGQLKLQGHILIVPQGTGDVADGQVCVCVCVCGVGRPPGSNAPLAALWS